MSTILRTLGNGFRLVGPLTVANMVIDPSFELLGGSSPWIADDDHTTIAPDTSHKVTGLQSCEFDVASDMVSLHSFSQALSDQIRTGATYTFGCSVYVPLALTGAFQAYAEISDVNDNVIDPVTGAPSPGAKLLADLTTGGATSDFVSTSTTFLAPPNSSTARFGFVVVGTSARTVYVDQAFFVMGEDLFYADGNTAGYVWSGDPEASTTLKSTMPDQVHFFSPSNIPVVA